MNKADERKDFDAFMARHVQQLVTFARPYVGRLGPEQKEAFLKIALERAWEKRAELQPRKSAYAETTIDILRWWEDNCLVPAARSRKEWRLRTWDGYTETVRGVQLGRQRT